jgi:hypothetical protein
MATWAYECRPAGGSKDPWYVACMVVDAMPPGTRVVRVLTGGDWHCAVVDRQARVAVASMLLHDVIASDEVDCPECAPRAAAPAVPEPARPAAVPRAGREVQAAAMQVRGHRFVVVLVGLDLVQSAGEADMAITDLRPRFGGVDVVLMGQEDDGTPVYHGHETLRELLDHIPVDQMPWKAYPVG